jgi:predicted transposase YdaD
MATTVQQYHSDLFRQIAAESEAKGEAKGKAEGEAKGKAEGKAEGEARAVVTVLETRGIAVPATVRELILACTDLGQLDTWLRRALTATTADDLTRG